jgi:hypothetical protein
MSADTFLFAGLVFGLPLLLGAQILARIGLSWRDDGLSSWGWAWAAGAVGTGLALLIWVVLGLPVRAAAAGPAVALLLVWLAGRIGPWRAGLRRERPPLAGPPPAGPPPGSPLARGFFALAVVLALVLSADRIVRADATVIVVGDEAAIWSSRAKALWWAGGLNAEYGAITSRPIGIVHADYPLLNPLLQLHVFAAAGRMTDVENRLPLQACGLALVLVLAGGLRRRAHPALAGVLLLLFATSTRLDLALLFAEADGLVALGLLVALDALDRFVREPRSAWLSLLALALALLVGAKHEGSLLALCVVAGAAACPAFRRAWRPSARPVPEHGPLTPPRRAALLAWLALPAAVLAAGWAVNAHFGFENDMVEGRSPWPLIARTFAQAPDRLVPAALAVGSHLLGPALDTHRLLLAYLVLAVLFPRRLLLASPSGCVLLLALLGYTAVYVGTPHGLAWHVRTSLPRLLFHLLPAAVLWVGWAGQTLLGRLPGSVPVEPGLDRAPLPPKRA